MMILAIESATAQVGCAIGGPEGVIASVQSARDRRHAESLVPQIDFARSQSGVELSDLDAIAVDVGPGLYTGLRVGVTTAMTMAHALGVPVVAVSSLDVVAFPLRFADRPIEVVIDARRGEVFHARYQPGPDLPERISEPAVLDPADLARQIRERGREVLIVGDGALRYRSDLDDLTLARAADPGLAFPSAASLAMLARARAEAGDHVPPDEIRPLYLRRPDAQAKWVPAGEATA